MSVETFLTNGPLSLDEIVSAIRTQSLDAKSNPVFNDSEIKLAVLQAIRGSIRKFFLTGEYEVTHIQGTYEYTLPSYIQRIISVVRTGSGTDGNVVNTLSGTSVGQENHYFRHVKLLATNTLYLLRDYSPGTLRILYERDVTVPIDNRKVSGTHTAAIVTLTLTDVDPQLYHASLPAYFRWGNEVIEMTAFASNTSATIGRGKLGSTAASHLGGSEISQLVTADSQSFYNFLFQEAGRLMNQFRVQGGTQNVSVAANITAAGMFQENREAILREIPQHRRTRTMKFRRERRPRRGV